MQLPQQFFEAVHALNLRHVILSYRQACHKCRCYTSATQVLRRYYAGTTLVLRRYYACTRQVVRWYYAGGTLVPAETYHVWTKACVPPA